MGTKIKLQSEIETKFSIGDNLYIILDSWYDKARIVTGKIEDMLIFFGDDINLKDISNGVITLKDINISYKLKFKGSVESKTIYTRGDSISYQGVGNNVFKTFEEAHKVMSERLIIAVNDRKGYINKHNKEIIALEKRIAKGI